MSARTSIVLTVLIGLTAIAVTALLDWLNAIALMVQS